MTKLFRVYSINDSYIAGSSTEYNGLKNQSNFSKKMNGNSNGKFKTNGLKNTWEIRGMARPWLGEWKHVSHTKQAGGKETEEDRENYLYLK